MTVPIIRRPMARFSARPTALTATPTPTPTTITASGYPWLDGELLYAADLNAAVPSAWTGLNVVGYGAKLDTTTDDTAAFNAAFGASTARGTVYVPPGGAKLPGPGAIGTSNKPVLWRLSGNTYDVGTTIISKLGNGIIETVMATWTKFFSRGSTIGVDQYGSVVRADLIVDHTGGTGSMAALEGNVQSTAAAQPGNPLVGLDGNVTLAATTDGLQPGYGMVGTAVRASGAGNAAIIGVQAIANDANKQVSSAGGPAAGAQVDLQAWGAEDSFAADGWNNGTGTSQFGRYVLDLRYARTDTADATPTAFTALINAGWLTVPESAVCSAKNGVMVYGAITFAGLNLLHASVAAGAQAIALQTEQTIGWSTAATNTVPTAADWHTLQYRNATGRLYYVVNGVDQWSVDNSGNVRARGTVTGSTTP